MILDGATSELSAIEGGKAAQSQAKMEEDLNHFLNLLVTQLKNQDPLEPMKSNEFTQQLVQFASVEQQIQSNANLEKILQVNEQSHMGSMVGYIGKQVEMEGQQMQLSDGHAEFTYELQSKAASGTLTIRNASGDVVYWTEADVSGGKKHLTWDGTDNYGKPLEDGMYSVNVNAKDAHGESVDVKHTTFGQVSGVRMDNGEAYLEIGNTHEVGFDKVISVGNPPPTDTAA